MPIAAATIGLVVTALADAALAAQTLQYFLRVLQIHLSVVLQTRAMGMPAPSTSDTDNNQAKKLD